MFCSFAVSDNIYMFEGRDYSKVIPESDRCTFDRLLAERVKELESGLQERALRRENKASGYVGDGRGGCVCVCPCCKAVCQYLLWFSCTTIC